MFRILPCVALFAAMAATAPTLAADWGMDDWGEGEPLRGSYFNEPKDWSGLGDETDALAFEVGLRYWYSWGAMSVSSGGTTSSSDQSHIGEAHLRIEDHSSNAYMKALGGYSIAIDGNYSTPSGSDTIADGHIAYFNADFGWNAWGDGNGSGFGGLIGYGYWNEAPDTGRYNYTTATDASDIVFDPDTGQTFLPGDSAPNNLTAHMLRLGLQGKAKVADVFDVTAELAAVPYAKVSGTVGVDEVSFNTDEYAGPAQAPYSGENGNIDFMRSSPTELDGWGYGAMAELWVGVKPAENITFRVGGRAWYLQGTADATYSAAEIGNPSDSDGGTAPNYDTAPTFVNADFISVNNPFSIMRYGLLAELTYAF